jgi:phosphoribosylglycinamide formyltransferase 1
MKRIAILISGRGSNMEAIVRACRSEGWPAEVVAVLSNRADAAGLVFAREHGIATAVVEHKSYALREDFDEALAQAVQGFAPDVVVLAGFMRILGPAFVARFEGRLFNIHPSLLPAFPGLHTHRRALELGCQFAGATVHLVTAELDHGPIVVQAAVPVLPGDDEASLAARVLSQEHLIYPLALRWWVDGRLRVHAGRVQQLQGAAQWHWAAPD